MKDWNNLLRLFLMLFTDVPPKKMDAIYLPGLSEGMIEFSGLFDHIVHLSEGKIPICFNGSDGRGTGERNFPGAAWPGGNWYVNELRKRGVHPHLLIPTRGGVHSRDEIDAMVELAKEMEWKNIGIVTVPYHYPRSFICLIKAMEQTKYSLNAYAIPSKTSINNWWLEMDGSQGEKKTVAFDECTDDFERFFMYQEKGFGSSSEELFRYLRDRT